MDRSVLTRASRPPVPCPSSFGPVSFGPVSFSSRDAIGARLRGLLSIAFLLLFVAPSAVRGATLLVPTMHPTIQAAVDAAVDGDVIEIAAGTYFENIDLGTKAITVRGAGIDATIIDGSALTAGEGFGSVIRCSAGIDDSTAIEHLTLRAGTGTFSLGAPEPGGAPIGGGVYAPGGIPRLTEVAFLDNSGDTGGGAYLIGANPATIEGCRFEGNTAEEGAGCIIRATSTVLVRDSTFEGNTAVVRGGGIFVVGTEVRVEACRFEDNVANWQGGAIFALDSGGSTDPNSLVLLEVDDSTFIGNSANSGGVVVVQAVSIAFQRCTFRQNNGGWQLFLGVGDYLLSRCVFSDTTAASALITGTINTDSITLDHCTLTGIDTPHVIRPLNTPVTVRNSIARDAFTTGLIAPPVVSPQPEIVEYSNISGGFPGIGNIDADPLFSDAAGGEFRLSPASPSVDTADPASPLDPDGTAADMGALPLFQGTFTRGDANADGTIDVADPLRILGEFFFGQPAVECRSAADANDDEVVNLADPIFVLNYLFQGGSPPPAPVTCGLDPTPGTACATTDTGC